MKVHEIKQLHQAMVEGGFAFLELETSNTKIRMVTDPVVPAGQPAPETSSALSAIASAPEAREHLITICSERVGVFGFGKTPVPIGATVKKGDVLGVIKGISMQEPVKSPTAGKIKEIHIQNGAIVEFGKKLFTLVPLD
jgi:biotin carboxyl carrier protein